MSRLRERIVFITGASSGIGRACAGAFADEGARLLLAARRIDRLDADAAEWMRRGATEVRTVRLDVRDRDAVFRAVDGLPDSWKEIDVLVSNAGLSRGLDKLHEGNLSDWEEMIDTNVKGLLYVDRAVVPGMVARGHGTVIHLGSLAGWQAYPAGNVYCATKSAVRTLTDGLRLDLLGTGVRALCVDPGLVAQTEFSEVRFHGDAQRASAVYRGTTPITAADVAEVIVFAATRPPHVCLADVLLLPTEQASATHVFRRS